jgi:hypothetical protein
MSRTRTVTGAGVIATVVLVLLFGNQAITEWVNRHYPRQTDFWSWFLHQLTWPAWAFSPRDGSSRATRDLLAQDLRALFLVLFVAVILAVVSKSIVGGAGAFFLGWASLVFGSALAAFITAWVTTDPGLLAALGAAAAGSAYGLFVGWIVGIATGTAKRAPAAS